MPVVRRRKADAPVMLAGINEVQADGHGVTHRVVGGVHGAPRYACSGAMARPYRGDPAAVITCLWCAVGRAMLRFTYPP